MSRGGKIISFILTLVIILSGINAGAQIKVTQMGDGDETLANSDSIAVNDSISLTPDSVAVDSLPPMERVRPNRSVTPIDIDDEKPPVVLHYYDKHGDPLDEPVLFLASLDTIVKPKSKPVYALYNGVSIGVNFADAILMAAGQKYGSFDIWADVSLHNWFFPIIEAGVGFADSHPEHSNYHYKTKPSFYTKVGINYNFLYKSNDAYQCFLGLRAGYSNFSYDVSDVRINSDYWGESQVLNIKGLSGHSFYGEVLAGIKVKIVNRFSLGWTLRYHFNFKTTSNSYSTPWFIPGYGATSPISFSLSAIYTIPGGGKREPDKIEI